MKEIQTAIQELISELKALKQTKVLMPSLNAIDDCINLAYAKIEVEKRHITNCFEHADMVGRASIVRELNSNDKVVLKYPEISAEQYFNETFKSK